jgi:hypothetical protein
MYRIIFRTCDKVSAVNRLPRPFGLDKRSVIELCFQSLVTSLDGIPHSIHVIADDISDGLRDFFRQFPVTLSEGTFGNEGSIRASLELAKTFADADWVYLAEDDYLHTPQAFLWIDDFIRNRDQILLTRPPSRLGRWLLDDLRRRPEVQPLVIHPADYPDRYLPHRRERAFIFLSQYCHWRQIWYTTFTFLAQASTFKQFAPLLVRFAAGADDDTLSRRLYARGHMRGKALCVSPIPGVATHMHEGVMTPLVDWEALAAPRLSR